MQIAESKTVRISASAYYKLAELSGLFSVLLGDSVSLSFTMETIITATHLMYYPRLVQLIANPKELKKVRAQFGKELAPILEILGPVLSKSNEIDED